VIGVLGVGAGGSNSPFVVAFHKGLAESGYIPGQNLVIEYRWTIYVRDLPRLAAELVNRKVDVIVTTGSPYSAMAAKDATSTIPIVFEIAFDPVKYGLVTSLNRPGGPSGNITGMTFLSSELPGKRLSLLLDLITPATRIAYLSLPISPVSEDLKNETLSAARSLGRDIIPLEFPGSADSRFFETAFKALVDQRVGALLVGNFSAFLTNRNTIVELAARQKIPAMYHDRLYVADGGLMSYAAHRHGPRELALSYVAQILKGAKPTDLPVRQPTEFELTINLKTANAMGLTIPRRLLAAADELIE
jgi:putative ABC transport system substrate-binding protein